MANKKIGSYEFILSEIISEQGQMVKENIKLEFENGLQLPGHGPKIIVHSTQKREGYGDTQISMNFEFESKRDNGLLFFTFGKGENDSFNMTYRSEC